MRESRGDVTEAGPSIAVQMVGLNTVPIAGDEFCVCSSEQEVHSSPTISTSLASTYKMEHLFGQENAVQDLAARKLQSLSVLDLPCMRGSRHAPSRSPALCAAPVLEICAPCPPFYTRYAT